MGRHSFAGVSYSVIRDRVPFQWSSVLIADFVCSWSRGINVAVAFVVVVPTVTTVIQSVGQMVMLTYLLLYSTIHDCHYRHYYYQTLIRRRRRRRGYCCCGGVGGGASEVAVRCWWLWWFRRSCRPEDYD